MDKRERAVGRGLAPAVSAGIKRLGNGGGSKPPPYGFQAKMNRFAKQQSPSTGCNTLKILKYPHSTTTVVDKPLGGARPLQSWLQELLLEGRHK